MSNPNSKVTLRLRPKRKRSRVNGPLDDRSPTPFGFNSVLENNNYQSFDKKLIIFLNLCIKVEILHNCFNFHLYVKKLLKVV